MHRILGRRRLGAGMIVAVLALSTAWAGSTRAAARQQAPAPTLDEAAESYVKLLLAFQQHLPQGFDPYYGGPEEWRIEAESTGLSTVEIQRGARRLATGLEGLDLPPADETLELRRRFLLRHAESLAALVDFNDGRRWTFDQESKVFFDATAPRLPEAYFEDAREELDRLLPGEGDLGARYRAHDERFSVPPGRIEEVFRAALAESRDRTRKHIELPDDEGLEIRLVEREGPPRASHSYRGGHRSVIELSVSNPMSIGAVPSLAAHEGYPGHHVQAVLIDTELLQERGWVEFSPLVLFSPFALIVEGTGQFAFDVAFPSREELVRFQAEVLFPLAAFDPMHAERVVAIHEQVDELRGRVLVAAARRYVDGDLDREGAVEWIVEYGLWPTERAAALLGFLETARSYVINYTLGRDLVREHVEALGGTRDDPETRWKEFERLLRSPRIASTLESTDRRP